MIKIQSISMDELFLEEDARALVQEGKGCIHSCSKKDLNGRTYYIERENNRVATVSTQAVDQIELLGTLISPKCIDEFAKAHNGYQVVDGFIFPSVNLVLTVSQDQEEFSEVLLYADYLKDDYERECVDPCIRKIEANNTICVVPYESINGFVFGDTEYAFQERTGLLVENYIRKNIIKTDSALLSFYDGTLGQVNIKLRHDTEIKIRGTLIQARDIVQFLRNSEQGIERGFFYVFPKLGISIDRDIEQIIGFDKRIAVYWENIHRPITSW